MATPTSWYRAGSISVTNGSKIVAGVGTLWSSQVLPGDLFYTTDANGVITSAPFEVDAVDGNYQITLKSSWPGASATTQKYAIVRNFTGTLSSDLATRLTTLIQSYQSNVDVLRQFLTTDDQVTFDGFGGDSIQTYGLLSFAESAAKIDSTVRFDAIQSLTSDQMAQARNNIGAQTFDSDLASIAALSGGTGFLKKTAANTWALDTNTYLTGNQNISVSGDATGSGTTSIALTLANSGVTAGTYKSVNVDAKGRVTGGSNPTTLSGYGITDAALSTHTHSCLVRTVDSRSVATAPNDYNSQFIHSFKTNSTIGTPDGSTYSSVVGLRAWFDYTGGNAHELAFTGNGGLFRRHGSTTAWNSWLQIIDSGNIGSQSVSYASTAGSAPASDVYAWAKASTKPTYTYSEVGAAASSHVGDTGAAHGVVTTSVAGFMSAADKTKLDGIAAGATAGGGTVTSVALSLPSIFSVSGSPVTSSGTLSASLASQTAAYVFAAPSGTAGTPTFRALVASDIPTLNQSTTGSAATLTTARTLTLGSKGKTFNGSANVSWTLAEMGAAAVAQTMYIGTTAVAINRASGSLALTGISGIDGNAATATTATNLSGGTATLAAPTAVTAVTSLTTAPVAIPQVNVDSTASFVPATHQQAIYASGYRTHVNTGIYKDANAWNAGWYCAIGGNDSYPTEYFQLRYGGDITHSSGRTFLNSSNYTSYTNWGTSTLNAGWLNLNSGTNRMWMGDAGGAELYLEVGDTNFSTAKRNLHITGANGANGGTLSVAFDGFGVNGVAYANRFYSGFDAGVSYSFSCSNWFRSNGDTGWYNATYGGGIYMTDTTYVRAYNGCGLWAAGNVVSTSAMQAPIYYDYNNTNYYLDPASTSNLMGANFNAESHFNTTGYTDPDSGVTRAIKVGSGGIAVLGGGKFDSLTVANTISGAISGNAATATKLATARTINGVSFDGSANITIAASVRTSDVLTATAGASVGAVGTYAYLGVCSGGSPGGNCAAGSTKAASKLFYAAGNNNPTTGSPSGTWRCMGYAPEWQSGSDNNYYCSPTLWLRIS